MPLFMVVVYYHLTLDYINTHNLGPSYWLFMEVVNIINFPSPLGPAVLIDIHDPLFRSLISYCITIASLSRAAFVFSPAAKQ